MNWKRANLATVIVLAGCSTASVPPAPPRDPTRISFTRVYCTPDNESHFETVTNDLARVDAAPPAKPFYAKGASATRVAFAAFDAGWGAEDEKARVFHAAPAAQYVIYLSGQMSVMTSDGDRRQFGPGDVLRVDDVAPCRGHISTVGALPAFTAVVR
jgi:hypothetical protein